LEILVRQDLGVTQEQKVRKETLDLQVQLVLLVLQELAFKERLVPEV
jgi:hypothetical protein